MGGVQKRSIILKTSAQKKPTFKVCISYVAAHQSGVFLFTKQFSLEPWTGSNHEVEQGDWFWRLHYKSGTMFMYMFVWWILTVYITSIGICAYTCTYGNYFIVGIFQWRLQECCVSMPFSCRGHGHFNRKTAILHWTHWQGRYKRKSSPPNCTFKCTVRLTPEVYFRGPGVHQYCVSMLNQYIQ